jgi:hypothetical protein
MRRGIALVAIVLAGAVAIACGGGSGDSQADACDFRTVRPTEPTTLAVSLEEAGEMLGVDVLVPQDLPEDVTMDQPFITRSGICPELAFSVTLWFRAPDYSFGLLEDGHRHEGRSSPDATPGLVNGHEAQVSGDENNATVSWQQSGTNVTAIANLGGDLTMERFLEILESIPE